MTERVIFRYVAENANARIVRIWEKIGPNTVRLVDTEIGYNFSNEQWETVQEFTRNYEITDSELLVGDGSNWLGDGMPWKEYAKQRHEKLLSCRFPYECGKKERTESETEIAKDLIQANY